MKNLDPKRARWIRFRMAVLCGAMGIGAGAFVASAFRVQVEDGPAWKEVAEKQRERRQKIQPRRGSVFERHGVRLAVSVDIASASLDVQELLHGDGKNAEGKGAEGKGGEEEILRDAAVRLSAVLSLQANDLYAKLVGKKRFVWLKRRISTEEANALRALGEPQQVRPVRGISIDAESRRFYPGRELGGNVLGFVSPDGEGKDGLELALDEELRGKPEEIEGLRDRSGRVLVSPGGKVLAQGHDLTLTIDEEIQRMAEAELNLAHRTYETLGASLVVMDPHTGEILAMASTPGFNPNDYSTSEVEARRDRPVTDRFEPGSVMKVFTVAGAMALGKLSVDEKIFCEHGTYKVGPVTIHDTHQNDWLSPQEILQRSSNIGALKIGLNLGEPGLYSTFRKFGFGEPTGIPLPGEATGVLRPKGRAWFDVETANASFGQGMSATTLQLATAMSAIANDGLLLEPVLVKKVVDADGNVVREAPTPHVRREAVPANIARIVRNMLVSVTEKGGTGEEAHVKGFTVAGKTATAQKVDPSTGKYSTEKFTSSFVGIVPADRPRLVIAVVLDEPTIGHYGGDLAGPVFRRLATDALRYLAVPSDDAKVAQKFPRADPVARVASKEPAVLAQAADSPDAVHVPDLAGLPVREAVRILAKIGLIPTLEGSGKLVKQGIEPGAVVPKGTSVQLVFEPAS